MVVARKKEHGGSVAIPVGKPTICVMCNALLIWADEKLRVRKASAAEIAELKRNTEYWTAIEKARSIIRERIRERNPPN